MWVFTYKFNVIFMCFYTDIFIKNNGFWFQVLSSSKVKFCEVQILTITYFQITGFDRFFILEKLSCFVRFIFLFFGWIPKLWPYTPCPYFWSFYIRGLCYYIKKMLLPHQNLYIRFPVTTSNRRTWCHVSIK